MIETCKNCRHCRRITNTEKVWDKDGLHVKTWYTYFCTAFKVEVPPINRCEHINKRVKVIVRHEVLGVTE